MEAVVAVIERISPLFITDNDLGIPVLDPNKQLIDISLPFQPWGARRRSIDSGGTRHFYIDDYKIEPLWKSPDKLLDSRHRFHGVIEPNFTIGSDSPKALAIWQIYRKRWLSRFWQRHGLNIMVDLFLDPFYLDLALIGVPHGWISYAIRGESQWHLADYKLYYNRAVERAGHEHLFFLVYGGGRNAKNIALKQGWLWFPTFNFGFNSGGQ